MQMRQTAALLFLTMALGGQAFAFDEPKNSSVAVEAKPLGQNLQLAFKVSPRAGLHINLEGPWKLELKNAGGLAFAKTTLVRADMDEKLPGFVLTTTAKPAQVSGEVAYKLIAFVCTNDKTQCYRDVHTGKAPWKVAAK